MCVVLHCKSMCACCVCVVLFAVCVLCFSMCKLCVGVCLSMCKMCVCVCVCMVCWMWSALVCECGELQRIGLWEKPEERSCWEQETGEGKSEQAIGSRASAEWVTGGCLPVCLVTGRTRAVAGTDKPGCCCRRQQGLVGSDKPGCSVGWMKPGCCGSCDLRLRARPRQPLLRSL